MNYIIFDLDGTLIDSMPLWYNIGHQYLQAHNLPIPDGLIEILKTQALPQTAVYFQTELGATQSTDEILSELTAYVLDGYANHVPLIAHARAYLEKQYQAGTKMCILTASELEYVLPALERLELLPYFSFVMTCSEVGCYKSDPAVYHMAMERLGGTLEQTVVFEDALYAIKGAKRGGFTVYALLDAQEVEAHEEIKLLADRTLLDYEALLQD